MHFIVFKYSDCCHKESSAIISKPILTDVVEIKEKKRKVLGIKEKISLYGHI